MQAGRPAVVAVMLLLAACWLAHVAALALSATIPGEGSWAALPGGALDGLWPLPAHSVVATPALPSARWLCLAEAFALNDTSRAPSHRTQHALIASARRLRRSPPTPRARGEIVAPRPLPLACGSARLATLELHARDADAPLALETDESYQLHVAAPTATLRANTSVGLLRGLAAFEQLVLDISSDAGSVVLGINASSVTITDAPRFPHRAVMLDSARHFLPVPSILLMLEAMALNRMNVLHWHLADSQVRQNGFLLFSFRFSIVCPEPVLADRHFSIVYRLKHVVYSQATPLATPFAIAHGMQRGKETPLLRHFILKILILPRQTRDKHRENSKTKSGVSLGALSPHLTYNRSDLERVVATADVLGIRVVPEVDSPGHVESWARALDSDMRIDCGISTVLNPVSAKVDRFVDGLIGELAEIFPSKEFHIGAHELNALFT